MKSSVAATFVALAYITPTLASLAHEARGSGNVCGSGIYQELAPILAGYPIAQAFCTAKYPSKCTTKIEKRLVATSSTSTTKVKTTITTTKSTSSTGLCRPVTSTKSSTTKDAKASAWSKCQANGVNVVSTMCSCIMAPPKACPTSKTATKSTKPSSTTTSKSSTTKIKNPTTTPSTTASTTPSTTASTTTTTTSSSSAPPAEHTIDAPRCNPETIEDDNGGCDRQCTCSLSTDGRSYCGYLPSEPARGCEFNSDCVQGDFCDYNSAACVNVGPPDDYCRSSYVPPTKRSVFGTRDVGLEAGRIGRRVKRGLTGA